MKIFRCIFVVSIIIFISSCAVKNIKDGKDIDSGKGFVGFFLKSNWKGNKSHIFSPIDFVFKKDGGMARKVTMKSSEDLFVIELDSGHYQPVAIAIGNTSFSLSGFGGFDVEPDKMIYIGDIYVGVKNEGLFGLMSGARISVADNADNFSEEMKSRYPATYKKYIPNIKVIIEKEW